MRVFLSYGHDETAALARRLKADLEAHSHEVWFDDVLQAGQPWEHRIERGIDWAADAGDGGRFLLLMTPHSVRRPDGFCLNEVAYAIERRLRVVPVMVVTSRPPLSIARLQWIDMRDCLRLEEAEPRYLARWPALLKALESPASTTEGEQSRLIALLKPLAFEVELDEHLSRFSGRQWILAEVDQWVASDDPGPLLLTGPPGFGKTALCARLCRTRGDVAGVHFVAFGRRDRVDARRCVTSLAYQLGSQNAQYFAALSDLDLRDSERAGAGELFERLLVETTRARGFRAPDGPAVLIIDALDEAGDSRSNELAEVLAEHAPRLPRWLRLLVTTRRQPAVLHRLQSWRTRELTGGEQDNQRDLREYVESSFAAFTGHGRVPPRVVEEILNRSEGIFLYVEVIRRELAAGQLSLDRVHEFPQGLGGIFARFSARQFPRIDTYQESVRPVIELIAAAREPLTVEMAARLLSWDEYHRRDMLRTLAPMFEVKGDAIHPFHRSAIEWFTDSRAGEYYASEAAGHRKLAEDSWQQYATGHLSAYALENLCEHLARAERWSDLARSLSDLGYLEQWDGRTETIAAYWLLVEGHSDANMRAAYAPVIARPTDYGDQAWVVAELLRQRGLNDGARLVMDAVANQARKDGNKIQLMFAFASLAVILNELDKDEESLRYLREQEALARELRNVRALSQALVNQAVILIVRRQLPQALDLLESQEALCRSAGLVDSLAHSLVNQSDVHAQSGRPGRALELAEAAETIYRELKDRTGIFHVLRRRAALARHAGELDRAWGLLTEAVRLATETDNHLGLAQIWAEMGVVESSRGHLDAALDLYLKQERVARDATGATEIVVRALCGQAQVLTQRGNALAGLARFEEAQRMVEQIGRTNFAHPLLGMASSHRALRHLGEAFELFGRVVEISRKTGEAEPLAIGLGNQAGILLSQEKVSESLPLFHEALEIAKRGSYVGPVKLFALQYAEALRQVERFSEAVQMCEESEAVSRKTGDDDFLVESLAMKGDTLDRTGDHLAAFAAVYEAETLILSGRGTGSLWVRHSNASDREQILSTAARKAAEAQRSQGDLSGALRTLDSVDGLLRQDASDSVRAALVADRSRILGESARFAEALAAAEEWARLCERTGDLEDLQTALHNQILTRMYMGGVDLRLEELMARQERLAAETQNDEGRLRAIGNRANAAHMARQSAAALKHFQQQERLARQLGMPEYVAQGLAGQVLVLAKMERLNELTPLLANVTAICRQYGYFHILRQIMPVLEPFGRDR